MVLKDPGTFFLLWPSAESILKSRLNLGCLPVVDMFKLVLTEVKWSRMDENRC